MSLTRLSFLFLLPATLAAQAPDTLWTRSFGSAIDLDGEFAAAVDYTPDGGFVFAGLYTGTPRWAFYLGKVDSTGDSTWTRTFGGATSDDECEDMRRTADDGFILAGHSFQSPGFGWAGMLVKTDNEGIAQWSFLYGSGSLWEEFYGVDQLNDGGFIATGFQRDSDVIGSDNVYLVRTNSSGAVVWERALGAAVPNNDFGAAVRQTPDHGFVVVGVSPYTVGHIWKLDSTATVIQWDYSISGTPFDVELTPDGGYIITGSVNSGGNSQMFLHKRNPNGSFAWSRTYGGASNELANDVEVTSDSGFVMTGSTQSFGAGSQDVYVVRTDSNGDSLWSKTVGTAASEFANAIRQAPNGRYIIGGRKPVNNGDAYLIYLGDPILHLLSPNGGNEWVIGETFPVNWYSLGSINAIRVELSRCYDSAPWELLADNTANDGTESFLALAPFTSEARIRITAVDFPTVNDVSDADFTILEPAPDTAWTVQIGTDDREARAIAASPGGTILAAGWSNPAGPDPVAAYVVALNLAGAVQWERTFGTNQQDVFLAAIPTLDGGFAMAGYTFSFGQSQGGLYLAKVNATGDSLWSQFFGGNARDYAFDLCQTNDSGYCVVGFESSFGGGGRDVYVVRTGSDGDSLWSRAFGGDGSDSAFAVKQTPDGGFIVAGNSTSFGNGSQDVFLIRLDAGGDTLWTKVFGNNLMQGARDVELLADGGFIAACYHGSNNLEGRNIWLIRTDANGDSVWSRHLGNLNGENPNSIVVDSDGGFVIGATYDNPGVSSAPDFHFVKTDSGGVAHWKSRLGGNRDDRCFGMTVTPDSAFALAGWSESNPAQDRNLYIVKTESAYAPPCAPVENLTLFSHAAADSVTLSFYAPQPADYRIYSINLADLLNDPPAGWVLDTTLTLPRCVAAWTTVCDSPYRRFAIMAQCP